MSLARRLFRFFIFSNLYIACLAVLMAWQTSMVLAIPADQDTLLFIFFATLCSYSFHWMLTNDWLQETPRSRWQKANRFVHPLLLVPGTAGSAWYAWKLMEHWPWLAAIAFVTFLYSAPKIPYPVFRMLRRIALGKTLFLTIVWTLATTLIPLVTTDSGWTLSFWLFLTNRFLLVYAICILFDMRDREYDRKHGIRSLITWMSVAQVKRLFFLTLLLNLLSAFALLAIGQSALTVCLLLLPAAITGLLYKKALADHGDLLYYFILDGLMALSAGIMAIRWLVAV